MRSLGEHAPEPTQARVPEAAPPRAAAPDRLLSLQRAAGNRAVGTVVARSPQAKPKRKPKPAPKDPQGLAERRISHIVLSGLTPIEVVSWSWQRGAIGGSGGAQGSVRELQVTTRTGAHSGTVMNAITEGREFARAELVVYGPRVADSGPAQPRDGDELSERAWRQRRGARGELGLDAQDVRCRCGPRPPKARIGFTRGRCGRRCLCRVACSNA